MITNQKTRSTMLNNSKRIIVAEELHKPICITEPDYADGPFYSERAWNEYCNEFAIAKANHVCTDDCEKNKNPTGMMITCVASMNKWLGDDMISARNEF